MAKLFNRKQVGIEPEHEAFPEERDELVDKLREMQRKKRSKEKFLKTRMWFSTAVSFFYPDRVTIPPNIGNNVFLGNNQIMTKNSITTMTHVVELSDEVPISFTSDAIKAVKNKVPGVYVDFLIKTSPYTPDLSASGMESRKGQWLRTMNNPLTTAKTKERSAKLLYTYNLAKSEEPLYRVHMYFQIRAKNGKQVKESQRLLGRFLSELKIEYKHVKSKIMIPFEYTSLASNKGSEKVRDIPYMIMSATSLAEILPTVQGLNDERGNFLGINLYNKSPYDINFRESTNGKGIYITGRSGFGKTFLVQNWIIDAYAIGFRSCNIDIKGNEFTGLTLLNKGKVVSMRQEAKGFVNTLVMRKAELDSETSPSVYFNNRFLYTKQVIGFSCRFEDSYEVSQMEALIEEFLHNWYLRIGVLRDNTNTWHRSEVMHPLDIYEEFKLFCSKDIMRSYPVAEKMLNRMKAYFSPSGSNSHIFEEEIHIGEILQSNILTFDFGLLNSSHVVDAAILDMKLMFMTILNNMYVAYNNANGIWTFKTLEESQIVTPFLTQIYSEEFTLRRSQRQVTCMLGNSVTALENNPNASAILDNISILAIGKIPKSSRDYLIREFSLEDYADEITNLSKDPKYENKFMLVNQMQKHATTALIQAYVPKHVRNSKMFAGMKLDEEVEVE